MSSQSVTHKRGDTFDIQCTYKDTSGAALDLTNYTIKSQIRKNSLLVQNSSQSSTGDSLVSECVVLKLNQSTKLGQYTLHVLDTKNWPLGNLSWDIQYSFDSAIVSTNMITINVIAGVTM